MAEGEGEIRAPNFGTSEMTLEQLQKKIRENFGEQNLRTEEMDKYAGTLKREVQDLQVSIIRLKKDLEGRKSPLMPIGETSRVLLAGIDSERPWR